MGKKIIVVQNWTSLKQADVASFAINTAQKMTDNPNFAKPAIDLETMAATAGQYTIAFGNRLNGKNAREAFMAIKSNLFDLLQQQATYVTSVAGGDTQIITSGGWEASKGSISKKTTPTQPKAPAVAFKNGDLTVSTSTVKGATSYLWVVFLGGAFPINITNNQLDINQSAKYIIVPAGTTRECVRNVSVGADVTVQVLAQNTAGKSSFSVPVSFHTGG